MLGLLALVVLVSVFKKLVYRFQVFFSSVFAVVAGSLAYSICFMGVVITSFDGVRGDGLSPELFAVVEVSAVVLLAGSTAVHMRLLRRRLRVGPSEKGTMGNFEAVSRASRSRTYWITFPLVAVVGLANVLTQGSSSRTRSA